MLVLEIALGILLGYILIMALRALVAEPVLFMAIAIIIAVLGALLAYLLWFAWDNPEAAVIIAGSEGLVLLWYAIGKWVEPRTRLNPNDFLKVSGLILLASFSAGLSVLFLWELWRTTVSARGDTLVVLGVLLIFLSTSVLAVRKLIKVWRKRGVSAAGDTN